MIRKEREKKKQEKKLFVGARLLGSSNGLPEVANLPTVGTTQEWEKRRYFSQLTAHTLSAQIPTCELNWSLFLARMKSDEEQSAEKKWKTTKRSCGKWIASLREGTKSEWKQLNERKRSFFLQISSSLLFLAMKTRLTHESSRLGDEGKFCLCCCLSAD